MRAAPPTPLAALAVLVLAAAPTAAHDVTPNYDQARTDRWRCRLCPFEPASHREGRWTVGAIAVEDAEPRFGRDNGLDEDGHHVDVHADYRRRGEDGGALTFAGEHLGLDARDARFAVGTGRGDVVALRWRELPRNVAADGRTPYTGRASLSLPAGWVPAFNTSDMTALSDAARAFDHATHRRQASAAFGVRLRPRWRVAADYARETKRGTEETYADFLYQATALPKPIDHETEEAGGTLRFEGDTLVFATSLRNARFRNAHESLEWENAFSAWPAAGRKALAPDNDARSLSVVSRWTRGRTTLNGTLAWGRLRQDAPFLPYTRNTALDLGPPPADGLRGRVRTFAGRLRLVSVLTDRLRVGVEHRRRDRDHATRKLVLAPVLGDFFASAPRESRLYDLDDSATRVRVQYRPWRRVRVAAGAATQRVRRAPLEIERNNERGGWLELSATGPNGLRATVRVADARRDASGFRDLTTNNPRMRRFHQAERRQRTWKAEVDYHFASLGLSVGLDADHRRNDHPDSALGLLHDQDRGWGVDFAYAPGGRLALSGFHAERRTGSRTAGSNTFSDADWWYGTRDDVATTGLTLDARGLARGALDLSITYAHSRGRGRYDTALEAATNAWSAFPTLVSEHRALDVRGRYRLRERVTLTARYYHEDYGATDWALDGAGLAAAWNLISFGRVAPDYGNGLFSVSVETRL